MGTIGKINPTKNEPHFTTLLNKNSKNTNTIIYTNPTA
jgi:hypothetical protein